MQIFKTISEGFNSFWNYIFRLVISTIVFILYLYIFIFFSTDGSNNIFLYLFYTIIFSIPICLARTIVNNKKIRIFFCFVVILYSAILFFYYSQFINAHIVIWLAITSLLLIKKVKLYEEEQEVSMLVPLALFILIIIMFSYGYLEENSYFKHRNISCSAPVITKNIVGLSQESKTIIDKKEIAIVNPKTCSTKNGNYEFIVMPIKNKFFSKQSYMLNSDLQTLNELLSEIKYVSNFYNSYLVSYASGMSCGIINSIMAVIKALIQIVLHPLDTLSGIYNAITSIPSQFLKIKNDPSIIIKEPIHDARKYLDDKEKDIARKNNIDIDRLILPETQNALRHERNILVIGEKGTELGIAVVPFFGNFGKTAKAIQAVASVKATKAITASSTKVAELSKAQKIITKTNRSHYEIAKTSELGKPIENVTLNNTKKTILSPNKPLNNLDAGTTNKKSSSKKLKGGGPEDQLFDKNGKKGLIKRGEEVYEEASFRKGSAGVRGRKPTPDALSVDHAKKIKTYIEDKRPSEWENNSWRSHPKPVDPIQKERAAALKDFKDGKITKAEADARIVIAENDDHFLKRGTRWTDPEGVPTKGYKDMLGVRMPDAPPERVEAFIKYLKDSGRNPEVVRENGIAFIRYDVKK